MSGGEGKQSGIMAEKSDTESCSYSNTQQRPEKADVDANYIPRQHFSGLSGQEAASNHALHTVRTCDCAGRQSHVLGDMDEKLAEVSRYRLRHAPRPRAGTARR